VNSGPDILGKYQSILETIRDRLAAEDFAAVFGLLDEMDRVIGELKAIFEKNPGLKEELKPRIQDILDLQRQILSEIDARVGELSGAIREMPKLRQAAKAYVKNKK
jgi:hypothetical protein